MSKHKTRASVKEQDNDTPLSYSGPLKRAFAIATHYGFNTILPKNPQGSFKRGFKDDAFFVPIAEKEELIKDYLDGKFSHFGSPTMLAYTTRSPVERATLLKLEIIGSGKSVADALILKTALSILEDFGAKNFCINLNNIGDAESRNSYIRDLTNYYKKHLSEMDGRCRDLIKKDPLKILSCEAKKCTALRQDAPKPISYLSEQVRTHFKELLEFVENFKIMYRIEDSLLGNEDYSSKTIFEIKACEKESDLENLLGCPTLGRGGRYDGLAKKIGFRKNIPAVGITLRFPGVPKKESYEKDASAKKKPKAYFIQFGFEAKQKSLDVIEKLREAKIPIIHSLIKDDLGGQLLSAEKSGVPFIIIMGQKEVLDESVMIRNVENRSQDTVKISELGAYLKKLL